VDECKPLNCGNALTAVARLGLRASILTKLSDDGAGQAILDEFAADGVDTSAVVIEPDKSSPFTYIIVDRAGSTRTCIHTPGQGLTLVHFQLNLSAVYGIGGACRGCAARVNRGVRWCLGCAGCFIVSDTAQVELRSGRV